jgi:hypothetical protein
MVPSDQLGKETGRDVSACREKRIGVWACGRGDLGGEYREEAKQDVLLMLLHRQPTTDNYLKLTLALVLLSRASSEELLQPFAFWVFKDFAGGSFFFDSALMKEDDVTGDVAGKTHLVSDHHHGSAFGR